MNLETCFQMLIKVKSTYADSEFRICIFVVVYIKYATGEPRDLLPNVNKGKKVRMLILNFALESF